MPSAVAAPGAIPIATKSSPNGQEGNRRRRLDGLNTITGETGKFAGIKGKAPFQCKDINPSTRTESLTLAQEQFEHQLNASLHEPG